MPARKRWMLSSRGVVSGWPRYSCSGPPMSAIAAARNRQTCTIRCEMGMGCSGWRLNRAQHGRLDARHEPPCGWRDERAEHMATDAATGHSGGVRAVAPRAHGLSGTSGGAGGEAGAVSGWMLRAGYGWACGRLLFLTSMD